MTLCQSSVASKPASRRWSGSPGLMSGNTAGRAPAERLEDASIHIGDLDPLDPFGPVAHERVMEVSQRVELLPFLDRGVDDCDHVGG